MDATHENGTVQQNITEDEAALYDRQIRLWGLEAQQRMRNGTICMINLKGVATEVIKNIVLAGIGRLIVVDSSDVKEEDLGAGFFFREEDVGNKRVDAARSRIESLNPLVAVETISDVDSLDWDAVVKRCDIVCLTDGSSKDIAAYDERCRKHNKPFYAGGSYGLSGYIFCDLLAHEYLAPDRTVSSDQAKTIKHRVQYPSLPEALQHKWQSLTKRQARHQNVELVFSIFTLWEYQKKHDTLPSASTPVEELESIAGSLISAAGIKPQILSIIPASQLQPLAATSQHEFSPVCAVLGGLMGQDILKALGGRDPPIANFFVFDGMIGSGAVSRLSMPL
ncbi:hypothetical protein M422DRAFT_785159 [Sphaerobolus stellatus SS14]|uniref:THIF-type NAD/FAD binding fold domain-containing protein n=1 Tax=Sphaerobolus stellatus (strain SS14) TaxID=990650 RepID=A0A0C9UMY9_SPHS4|nr:hypothetical protein M422DRAFT_785159 [Sphaerobolus stellatus SS14]